MSISDATPRHKKRRRVVFASVGLLAALVAGSLVFAFVEQALDAADRAH